MKTKGLEGKKTIFQALFNCILCNFAYINGPDGSSAVHECLLLQNYTTVQCNNSTNTDTALTKRSTKYPHISLYTKQQTY